MQSIIRYFSKLRKFTRLSADARQSYLFNPDRTFVRNSPLTFPRTVSLVLNLLRRSLAVELARFFRWKPEEIVTKSAFCQRRKATKPKFFLDLFKQSYKQFYNCFTDHRRWKGKRLIAVDGSGQKLPYEYWIGEAFGFHQNQHDNRPSTRLLFTFDVLNSIIMRVDFHTQKSAEVIHAYTNVEQLPRDAIYLYDRHYASFGMAYLHDRYGSDYVIRMPLDGSNIVKDFVKSGKKEVITKIKLGDGRALRSLRSLELNPVRNAEVEVRLVRVELDDGEIEVLMTSLIDRVKYPASVFKWLYGKRWGVETSILVLKSFLQLALVSAYTQPGVGQDLWASFAFYNQQSALVYASEKEVEERTAQRQYKYKINRNVTAGIIKEFLYHIYLDGPAAWRSRTKVLMRLMPRYTEPVRPDRNNPREKKIMRAQERHIYEKNYRKAL
jgi:hypothetical protein